MYPRRNAIENRTDFGLNFITLRNARKLFSSHVYFYESKDAARRGVSTPRGCSAIAGPSPTLTAQKKSSQIISKHQAAPANPSQHSLSPKHITPPPTRSRGAAHCGTRSCPAPPPCQMQPPPSLMVKTPCPRPMPPCESAVA